MVGIGARDVTVPNHTIFRNMSWDDLSSKEQDCENKHKQKFPGQYCPQVIDTDANKKHYRSNEISAKLPKTEILAMLGFLIAFL